VDLRDVRALTDLARVVDARLVASLVVLVAITTATLWASGVRLRGAVLRAAGRAALQLAVVGALLRAVFAHPWAVGAVLLVMLSVAALTAGGRLRALPRARTGALLAVVAGAAPTLAAVFGIGAVAATPRYVVAVGGIVIGGTLTAVVLSGRRLLDGLRSRREEVEGWLALGSTPRQAARDVVRTAVGESLLPALDQTRTVALVTLPGAFVGALFGGASPAEAARFQLTVLVALLCAEALAAAATGWWWGAPARVPADAGVR
jgi:putative ABC transport system permease protein